MGDRCFMSVTCRRQDKERFEELGFAIALGEDKNTPIIEMIDEEANYGHCDEMPTNIPYYGSYSAGSNYGPGSIACDGRDYEEVPASSDGFVVAWNHRSGLPQIKSILRIRRYVGLERRVKRLFKALRKENCKEHIFNPDTHRCVKCGQHAEDDAVEGTPCQP
jgi:hypothetical protein